MIEMVTEHKIHKMSDEKLVDYLVEKGHKMFFNSKSKVVTEIAKRELAKMGITNCVVELKDLPKCISGEFIETPADFPNKLIINKYTIGTGAVQILGLIRHECTHAYQEKMEREHPEDPHSVKLKNSRSRNDETVDFCGFHFEHNNMYVSNEVYISPTANDLEDIFYYLCTSEREAFLASYSREKELCQKYSIVYSENNEIKTHIEKFKKRYNCQYLKDDEVLEMIDIAYVNLIDGRSPSTDKLGNLCANVMYDLCLITAYLSRNIEESGDLLRYLNDKEKHERLLKEGYTNVVYSSPENVLYDKFDYYLDNIEAIGEMNEVTQKDNPKLLALLCIYSEGKAFQYIKDKENLFKEIAEMKYTALQFEEMFPEECSKYMPTQNGIQI